MIVDRTNDKSEFGQYISRAREAIEEGLREDEEWGDKQSGEGLVSVPLDEIRESLSIVRELKQNLEYSKSNISELNKLESFLEKTMQDNDL